MTCDQPPEDIHVHLPGTLEARKYKTVLLRDRLCWICQEIVAKYQHVHRAIYLQANFHLPLTLWNANSGKSVSRMPRNSRLQLAEKSEINGSSHGHS